MRRMPALICFVLFMSISPFLSFSVEKAGGAEKTPAASTKAAPPPVRITRMRAAGIVTAISETTLKIERKVMDKVETMEFTLEKPIAKIKPGDKVLVSYETKGDKNIAARVVPNIPEQVIKKSKKAEGKTVPQPTPAPTK